MSASPDRRRFLTGVTAYAVGAAAVTGVAALASEAKGSTPARVSPELDRLIARVAQCQRASDSYQETRYEPARRQWTEQVARVPHHKVRPPRGYETQPYNWTTKHEGLTKNAIAMTRGRASFEPCADRQREYHEAQKRLARAGKRRQRALDRVARETRIREHCNLSDQMVDRTANAEDNVAHFRVRSLADLARKADFLRQRSGLEVESFVDAMVADILRLAAGEA